MMKAWKWWRKIDGAEKMVVVAVVGIIAMIMAAAVGRQYLDPCTIERPCLNWITADGRMQCTQVGEPQPIRPNECVSWRKP